MSDNKSEVKYTCELSLDQIQTVSLACEILARLGMGQFRSAMDHLPCQKNMDWSKWHDDMDVIGRILSHHMKGGVDGWRSSHGIASDEVSSTSKRAWDVHQVFRRRIAWDRAVKEGIVDSADATRKWPEMMTVDYDEPMNTTGETLPKITKLITSMNHE